jgi:hypothetical protein
VTVSEPASEWHTTPSLASAAGFGVPRARYNLNDTRRSRLFNGGTRSGSLTDGAAQSLSLNPASRPGCKLKAELTESDSWPITVTVTVAAVAPPAPRRAQLPAGAAPELRVTNRRRGFQVQPECLAEPESPPPSSLRGYYVPPPP